MKSTFSRPSYFITYITCRPVTPIYYNTPVFSAYDQQCKVYTYVMVVVVSTHRCSGGFTLSLRYHHSVLGFVS